MPGRSKGRRHSRRQQRETSSEAKSRNSTSTEDNGSVASDLSGDSRLQCPGGSQSTARSSKSANSSKSRSRNPFRTNARGIPEPILKEIIVDIEANGGLEQVLSTNTSLTDFCELRVQEDGKEAIYGTFKSSERDKVCNKIRTWGRLPPKDYQNILLYCGVTPSGLRSDFAQSGQDQTPKEISVPPLSSLRGKNPKTKAAVRQRLSLSSPRAASKVSDTPSQRTPLASPRGTAKQVATSSEETPNRSNVRGVRGGVNVNSYREPKPVLSSSDEEESSKQKRRGRRDAMSLQRTDEIPIGKLLLFLSSCIAKWA